MNTSAVWTALRRLWEPTPEVPVRTVDETTLRGEAAVQRMLHRLAKAGGSVSLQSEDAAFDHAARLLGEAETGGLALRLLQGQQPWPQEMPETLNVTACSEQGVLMFSLHPVAYRGQGRLRAPLPAQMILVQSRRHFRVTGLNGHQFHAELALPAGSQDRRGGAGGGGEADGDATEGKDDNRVLRLRNLSEEGVAFEMAGPGVPSGTIYRDVSLRLDDMVIVVPEMKVVYCRRHGEAQWTVGAHFERIGAQESRFLRRWIAAAQAAMANAHLDD
ncbi:PilZ domain-containing protein [Azohydromonas aeria]|uniref:PilZ domain-containing protein n=1 Tax=Azohydromonas aeria TaxID=2590212 RepID=UPI0012F7BF61|nr:PilZ domain-containing protein [Azohydromonas aeria]